MEFKENGILQFATSYVPADGPGAKIAPATYAEDKDHNIPAGPAISENVPHVQLNDHGELIIDGHTRSVVIDSIGSQVTRAENALWELREELSLPGIVLREGDTKLIENKIDEKYSDKSLISKEDLVDFFLSTVKIYNDESSSWNFPHRHIDGIIRLASSTPDGKTEIWNKDKDLKNRLIQASPRNMRELLKIAPNSAIYGYWLSTGAPINHKVPRSYSNDIIGYGASSVNYGATKISTLPTDSSLQYEMNAQGHLQESKKGDKASKLLLGSVPSYSTSHVTTENIVGKGSLLLGQLRAMLRQDRSLSPEEQDVAFQALAHLAVLGHLLKDSEWTLRSGCTLVPETMYWTEITPGNTKNSLDIPTVDEMIQHTKIAVNKAQDMGVLGSKEDIIPIYLSESLLNVSIPAFLKGLSNKEGSE